jgi:hypothetical protein
MPFSLRQRLAALYESNAIARSISWQPRTAGCWPDPLGDDPLGPRCARRSDTIAGLVRFGTRFFGRSLVHSRTNLQNCGMDSTDRLVSMRDLPSKFLPKLGVSKLRSPVRSQSGTNHQKANLL